ncbi:hypothetical protein AVEN_99734-1 [Araneus ventricosus]|uniref:Mariner Mos1 transposase n=1 Tax=Araneus ventricosus TaxID=182803 RepID=A0A4Y2CBG2_ARAVE|nr:hypothetical protein AVEN_99734-1 [Araneus ventricosus]
MSSLEQRTNIKFCVLLEKSPSETLEMLKKAYGNDAMNITKEGKISLRQKPRESDVGGFFDYDSVIHHEFIPEGYTANNELYLVILKRLRKRPEKWVTNDWFLLHDNAPPHCALIVKKYLARHNVTTLEHPPYSPGLAPAYFYLFPRLKMKLKGHRFVDSKEVIENATKQLKDLSKNGFQECFEQSYERWKKCVVAGGK